MVIPVGSRQYVWARFLNMLVNPVWNMTKTVTDETGQPFQVSTNEDWVEYLNIAAGTRNVYFWEDTLQKKFNKIDHNTYYNPNAPPGQIQLIYPPGRYETIEPLGADKLAIQASGLQPAQTAGKTILPASSTTGQEVIEVKKPDETSGTLHGLPQSS